MWWFDYYFEQNVTKFGIIYWYQRMLASGFWYLFTIRRTVNCLTISFDTVHTVLFDVIILNDMLQNTREYQQITSQTKFPIFRIFYGYILQTYTILLKKIICIVSDSMGLQEIHNIYDSRIICIWHRWRIWYYWGLV